MGGADHRRGQGFQGEVAGRDAVEGIGGGAVEAQGAGGHLPVDGEGGAGQGGGAERALVHPRPGVVEAAGVAAEHLHIGHQVVAEGDRLGRLQMGEAGHQGVGVGLGLVEKSPLKAAKGAGAALAGGADPQAKVERHLIVARARGVQAPGRLADQFGEPRLHVHVDVLEFVAEGKYPGLKLAFDEVSPAWMAASSSTPMIPVAASMAAWAREPAISSGAKRLSTPIETLIACMTAAGLAEKRPPHRE